nr:hypothetical protein BaRGS_011418 [Batillaria attramentaria]
MAHFETESMMHFGSYGEITELSFWITATRPDGLILYTVTTDTVALMLDGGQLRLHLVSRGSDIVSRVGSDLANGDWVRVGLTLGNGRYSLQAVSVTFDGSSSHVTMLIDRTKIGFGDNGGFQFRTRGESSTLMLLQFLSLTGGSDRFLEFRLYQGRVQVFSSFSQISSLVRLSDGAWHSVTWRRIHSYLLLTFDGVALYLRANMNPFDPRLNQTVQVYLGARPFKPGDDSHLVSHFKGCMRNLTFNQVTVPFVQGDSSPAGVTVRSDGLRPDCVKDDVCDVNPCPANSYCHDNWNAYTCPCLGTGYRGDRCQDDRDECNGTSVCFNEGLCINTVGSYECRCPAGWTGQQCGQNIDDCQSQPCLNGGRCADVVNGYQCDCTGTGYDGDTCEKNVDDCANNRCQNGAECVDGVRSYVCNCSGTGYEGKFCDTDIDECRSNPCRNNGTCRQGTDSFRCTCDGTGYHGDTCEKDVDECAEGQHNCSQDDPCVNLLGGYRCGCQEGDEGGATSDNTTGILVACIVIIVVILAVAGYAAWHFRRSRKRKGHYRPSEAEQNNATGIPMDKMADTFGERLI